MDPSLLPRGEVIGRIGTRFCTQNKGATKLRYIPFNWSTMVIVENPCPVFHIVISSIDIKFLLPFLLFLVFIDLYTHHPAAPTNAHLLMSKKKGN